MRMERRLRVSDIVLKFLTVRIDEMIALVCRSAWAIWRAAHGIGLDAELRL